MESTGLLWRQVDKAEMARRIRGQVVDTITKTEVQKVIDLLKESGREIDMVEYKMDDNTLDINLFGVEAKELRRHYPRLNKKEVEHPRMATNNLFIWNSGLPKLEIFKCEDDWFWVESTDDDYFICDGIQGLLSMLADYYTIEKKGNS